MTAAAAVPARKGLHIALWVVQVLLAAMFLMSGLMKSLMPLDELAKNLPWVTELPTLARFIGVTQVLAAFGLILPSVTRIAPKLTPLAALGLLVTMVLAAAFHASRGEFVALPTNFILAALAAFVAYGRFKLAPIAARG